MPLTNSEYVEKGGAVCPVCGHENVATIVTPRRGSELVLYQEKQCPKCSAYWQELFKLDEYQLLAPLPPMCTEANRLKLAEEAVRRMDHNEMIENLVTELFNDYELNLSHFEEDWKKFMHREKGGGQC